GTRGAPVRDLLARLAALPPARARAWAGARAPAPRRRRTRGRSTRARLQGGGGDAAARRPALRPDLPARGRPRARPPPAPPLRAPLCGLRRRGVPAPRTLPLARGARARPRPRGESSDAVRCRLALPAALPAPVRPVGGARGARRDLAREPARGVGRLRGRGH